MSSSIDRTNDRYNDLRNEYNALVAQGRNDNEIREYLHLTPQQFNALLHRELTSVRHQWREQEIERLFNLYVVYMTHWETIRDILCEEFDCSLSWEQVKNKVYQIKRSPRYSAWFADLKLPQVKRGRPPTKDTQRRRAKRQVFPLGNQGHQDPVVAILEPENQIANQVPLGQVEVNNNGHVFFGQEYVNHEVQVNQGPIYDLELAINGLGLPIDQGDNHEDFNFMLKPFWGN